VRVRRSSDDLEADFSAKDIKNGTLEAWVGQAAEVITNISSLLVNDNIKWFGTGSITNSTPTSFDFSNTASNLNTRNDPAFLAGIFTSDDTLSLNLTIDGLSSGELIIKGSNNSEWSSVTLENGTKTYNIAKDASSTTPDLGWLNFKISSTTGGSVTINSISRIVASQGSDGFVVKQYDQSGNNNNLTQSDPSSQPKIVKNGNLITDANNNPTIESENSAGGQTIGLEMDNPLSGVITAFASYQALSTSAYVFSQTGTTSFLLAGRRSTGSIIMRGASVILDDGNSHSTEPTLSTFLFNGANSSAHQDGIMVNNGVTDAVTSLGRVSGVGHLLTSEIILFNSNQSGNREAIETNINNYYGIYNQPEEVNLWLAGGQSNMVGLAQTPWYANANITSPEDAETKVYVAAGTGLGTHDFDTGTPDMDIIPQETWTTFNNTNKYGPERAMARELSKDFSNVHIAKFALNGSSLASDWSKGVGNPWFDIARDLYNDAIEALESQGKKVNLRGFLWVQGSTDSANEDRSNLYGANMLQLMSDFRSEINNERARTMPFIIVRNAEFAEQTYWANVEAGKEYAQANDPVGRTVLVSTADLDTRGDNVHYTAEAFETMGERSAEAFNARFKYDIY